MALIPHSFFPRSMMDMEEWNKPMEQIQRDFNRRFQDQWNKQMTTFDMFDPFDALDNTISRNLQWLNRPELMVPALPSVPQKYRITLDCTGYSPKSIITDIKGNILTVSGSEKVKEDTGDYSVKEFKKTYTLPERAECDKMVSFMTGDGQLCIEFPLRETTRFRNLDMLPQIIDNKDGSKDMQMKIHLPETVKPEHVHVNIKDRCLIVKADEKTKKPDGVSKFHYYMKTTLPENTNWDALKCTYDNNHDVQVSAPLNLDWTPTKKIAYENRSLPITEVKKGSFAGVHGETAYPRKLVQ